jgi:hypothetical protein
MPGARFLYSYNGQSVDVYLQKNQETKNDIIREYKEAQLFDLNGKLIVKSQLIVSNKFSLVTNKLSAGIYIVKLFHKNGQFETLKVSVR